MQLTLAHSTLAQFAIQAVGTISLTWVGIALAAWAAIVSGSRVLASIRTFLAWISSHIKELRDIPDKKIPWSLIGTVAVLIALFFVARFIRIKDFSESAVFGWISLVASSTLMVASCFALLKEELRGVKLGEVMGTPAVVTFAASGVAVVYSLVASIYP